MVIKSQASTADVLISSRQRPVKQIKAFQPYYLLAISPILARTDH